MCRCGLSITNVLTCTCPWGCLRITVRSSFTIGTNTQCRPNHGAIVSPARLPPGQASTQILSFEHRTAELCQMISYRCRCSNTHEHREQHAMQCRGPCRSRSLQPFHCQHCYFAYLFAMRFSMGQKLSVLSPNAVSHACASGD